MLWVGVVSLFLCREDGEAERILLPMPFTYRLADLQAKIAFDLPGRREEFALQMGVYFKQCYCFGSISYCSTFFPDKKVIPPDYL